MRRLAYNETKGRCDQSTYMETKGRKIRLEGNKRTKDDLSSMRQKDEAG